MVIVIATYKGHSASKDRALNRAAHRRSDGSGYCFIDGMRDISWSYYSEPVARAAAARMRRIAGVRVKVVD